ncbi:MULTISPECIES: hypothetical protein [unclassified Pseudomonas]|uniref:hypothetical protein n=1 Tax=unclassified Pseudomonas TaxID=196821 RepID=UPI0020984A48|nr:MULTISPECIES: hypothetical protein [unclassified Pseudomonas]MCO7504764.1 hypothetical protein [Pseudomonas sp. VE 267-6A]MCO7533113.1 hypothetical protein [Pseudomonas sp. 2]
MRLLRNDVRSGDVFYIPAMSKDGRVGFVLARFIEHVECNLGALIEVFKNFYLEPPKNIHEVDLSERLFRPILCSLRFSEIPRWKILFSDPEYVREDSNYKDIVIELHSECWVGGKSVPKAIGDRGFSRSASCEGATCWRMHHIIFRVNAHLSGILGGQDQFLMEKLPENMRIGNSEAEQKVIGLANEVDTLFRSWSTRKRTK